MKTDESGRKLVDIVKKAIHDCELTKSEYEEILSLASADSHIDSQELALLRQLQELLANNTIKRVAG
jgi:hypothetical protein